MLTFEGSSAAGLVIAETLASGIRTLVQRKHDVGSKSMSDNQRLEKRESRDRLRHHSIPVRRKIKGRCPAALPPIMGMTW